MVCWVDVIEQGSGLACECSRSETNSKQSQSYSHIMCHIMCVVPVSEQSSVSVNGELCLT